MQRSSTKRISKLRHRSNWLCAFLLAACVTRLWLMPLPSSFWTDEMGTAFVVRLPADPSLAIVQYPGSIYYALPRAAERLFGFSEVSYRIPSVLAMGIALFLIGRLAARLINPDAGWFAVFACLALSDFNYYAADARPYAFGISMTAASLYFLIEWLDTARWKPALLFVLFGALLWRVQLVFWAFYPVFPIYTLMRLGLSTRVSFARAFFVYCLLALALIPVAFEGIDVFRNAKMHVIAPMPGFRLLLSTIFWEPVALCAGLAWLSARLLKWRIQKPASLSAMTLICAWWLWMPLCLFAFSRIAGTVLFIPRYFSLALPGVALATAAGAAVWLPRERWKHASVALAIAGLIWTGQWTVPWPAHTLENWRQASSDADLAAEEPDTPVIAVSPYIEARPPIWSPDYHLPGFLYAPLFVYPVRGRVYPFPFLRSPDAERYAAALLRDTLLKRPRFIVYGAGGNTLSWMQWFSKRTELSSWPLNGNAEQLVHVLVFENPAPAGPR
jgi:hypothetical protein